MFSGIVATTVTYRGQGDDGIHRFALGQWRPTIALGSSISCDGVCLTAVEVTPDFFGVEIIEETLHRSTFSSLAVGARVNVEQSITAATLLDGGIVQGHVDCVGHVTREGQGLEVAFDRRFDALVVEKGGIVLNGVSLTVTAVGEGSASVALIPETLRRTNLGDLGVGSPLNIEFDIIGKYLVRQRSLEQREAWSQ
ncbi:MAG: riboflavin synthase [Ferrimicrobium sp.]|uniref:riboflavin synthase n=1 Tax=Ferrimicrobium sp. TaxID=2926050 RepID=UPI00261D9967|nr:riboflavin synthase [Ferrimicrobium sp.]